MPDGKEVRGLGNRLIIRVPDGNITDPGEIELKRLPDQIGIDHGSVAPFPDPAAESQSIAGELVSGYIICPGRVIQDGFRIINDRHLQCLPVQHPQDQVRFLQGLRFVDCLGKEIDADVQSRLPGFPQILLEISVLPEAAFTVAPVTGPDKHKIYARVPDLLPVNVLIVLRDIDARPPGIPVISRVCHPVFFPHKTVLKVDIPGKILVYDRFILILENVDKMIAFIGFLIHLIIVHIGFRGIRGFFRPAVILRGRMLSSPVTGLRGSLSAFCAVR